MWLKILFLTNKLLLLFFFFSESSVFLKHFKNVLPFVNLDNKSRFCYQAYFILVK